MIDPPRIANLLSAGQHNLNYFVRKRKIKCKCKVDFIVLFCFPVFFFPTLDKANFMNLARILHIRCLSLHGLFFISFEGNFQNVSHISTILTATYLVKFPVRQKPSIIPLNIHSLDVSIVIVVDINEVSSININ